MKQISILIIIAIMLTLFASCTIGKYEEESKIENVSSSLAESKIESSSGNEVSDEYSWVDLSGSNESSEGEISSEDTSSAENDSINVLQNPEDEYIWGMGRYKYYRCLKDGYAVVGKLVGERETQDFLEAYLEKIDIEI